LFAFVAFAVDAACIAMLPSQIVDDVVTLLFARSNFRLQASRL